MIKKKFTEQNMEIISGGSANLFSKITSDQNPERNSIDFFSDKSQGFKKESISFDVPIYKNDFKKSKY